MGGGGGGAKRKRTEGERPGSGGSHVPRSRSVAGFPNEVDLGVAPKIDVARYARGQAVDTKVRGRLALH